MAKILHRNKLRAEAGRTGGLFLEAPSVTISLNRVEAHILLGDMIRVLAAQSQPKTFATIGEALPMRNEQ